MSCCITICMREVCIVHGGGVGEMEVEGTGECEV